MAEELKLSADELADAESVWDDIRRKRREEKARREAGANTPTVPQGQPPAPPAPPASS